MRRSRSRSRRSRDSARQSRHILGGRSTSTTVAFHPCREIVSRLRETNAICCGGTSLGTEHAVVGRRVRVRRRRHALLVGVTRRTGWLIVGGGRIRGAVHRQESASWEVEVRGRCGCGCVAATAQTSGERPSEAAATSPHCARVQMLMGFLWRGGACRGRRRRRATATALEALPGGLAPLKVWLLAALGAHLDDGCRGILRRR
mmetsp:Transcript_8462/g.26208  ORF Transcript_8462/g.26208 Transcript_8462/m.26208 type:complete len:203 (+) Transcript_8462:2046-2654(+)